MCEFYEKFQPPECNANPPGNPWTAALMSCLEWYQKNTLLVEIYYERMNYQVLTESPAYSVSLVSPSKPFHECAASAG